MKLADTLDLGSNAKSVQVQVLSSVPTVRCKLLHRIFRFMKSQLCCAVGGLVRCARYSQMLRAWFSLCLRSSVPCLTVKIDPEEKKREKRRFREISPFFFDSNFFRISIDPFSIFFQVEEFELLKTHYFENFITNETNTKDLNPRQGFILFRFLC